MAKYKLSKVRNEEGGQTDAKGKAVVFYRGASARIACAQNKHGFLTGLTKEEESFYEKELNLEKGELNRNSEFWNRWCLMVDASGVMLDDSEAKDAMDIKVLKQREIVGLTLDDAKRPEVKFILTSEDHDAKVAIDARSYKKKAFAHFATMTPEDHRNYLTRINRRHAGLSPEAIEQLVGDDVELSPKKFLEVEMDGDKDIKLFVNELIHAGLLTKDGTAFRDAHTKEILAYRLDEVIDYLRNPENQPYYIQMQKQLAKTKKAK